MSIETNMKSIAESLKEMVNLQAQLVELAKANSAPVIADAVDPTVVPGPGAVVETPAPEPAAEVTTPADAAAANNPVTQEELAAVNVEFGQIAAQMNDQGAAIFQILNNHGLSQLAMVGDNRVLLDTILAEARALVGAAA